MYQSIQQPYQPENKIEENIFTNISQPNIVKLRRFKLDNSKKDYSIVLLVEGMLAKDTSLTLASQMQYSRPLINFYKWLYQNKKKEPNASDIAKYLSQTNIKYYAISAINWLRKIKNIQFKPPQQVEYLKAREKIKEQRRQRNKFWIVPLLQYFIDDLKVNKFENLAYRIFILFEIMAQVNDLSYITFSYVISNFNQDSEMKIELKKRSRYLELNGDVIETTSKFMKNHNLQNEQTLNVGDSGINYSVRMMKEQLSDAIQLLKYKCNEKGGLYFDFLTQFQYSSLIASKEKSLRENKVPTKQIQKFKKQQYKLSQNVEYILIE